MILRKRSGVEHRMERLDRYSDISPYDRAPEPNVKKPYLHPEIDFTPKRYDLAPEYVELKLD